MTRSSPGRTWPWLDSALFACALCLYVLVVPLGLSRVEAASQVAAGVALDTSAEHAAFAILGIRLLELLPLGDAAFRANLASALFCACAATLLGRLCVTILPLLRPPPHARRDARDALVEPLAAATAGLAFALSLSVFDAGVGASSAAATLALLLTGMLATFWLLRDVHVAWAGYLLAAASGLALGVDAVAGPLLWPLALGLAIWSLRKGARWPLLAPLCFVATAGAALLAVVAASPEPLSLASALSGFRGVSAHLGASLVSAAFELCDEVGAIALLLAVLGVVVLVGRAALVAAWLALMLLTALLFVHPVARGVFVPVQTRAALPLAIAVTCVFSAVGLLHLAAKLGRARAAATLTLAVMVLLSPALDGGVGRWSRRAGLPMRLLDHALARAEPRAVVDPGSPEMDGLFRLARALGLRPDIELRPRQCTGGSPRAHASGP